MTTNTDFVYKGTFDTLPGTGELGEIIYLYSTDEFFVYTGNEWMKITGSEWMPFYNGEIQENSKIKAHPETCKHCGAALHSNKCEYCGVEYTES